MQDRRQKVVLITGASSGIGEACAQELSALGYKVYGTSRRPAAPGLPYAMLQMDVTDDESVREAMAAVVGAEGRVDALVNNAGYALAGAVEDTDIDEALLQLNTNFFGAARLTRAVLPVMRQQGGGTIVNISSIAGLIAIPYQAFYSASKFALEGYSEGLRLEVERLGIRVVLIEPGDHRTPTTANRIRTRNAGPTSAYSGRFETALGVMEHDEEAGPPPSNVAKVVRRVIEAKSPALRHPVGGIPQIVGSGLKRLLPYGLFVHLIRSTYKL